MFNSTEINTAKYFKASKRKNLKYNRKKSVFSIIVIRLNLHSSIKTLSFGLQRKIISEKKRKKFCQVNTNKRKACAQPV
jgi:hypothetical protein